MPTSSFSPTTRSREALSAFHDRDPASRLIEADLGLAVANRRLGSPGAESD